MDAMPLQQISDEEKPRDHHVCPWWVGYLIMTPLRKLGENPKTILAPLVEPGMTAVDIGCGMGFFGLPLARMVGDSGRVVCVDVQEKMLSSLRRRATRKGLEEIIETRLATQEDLGFDDLAGAADLILAVHVLHEAHDRSTAHHEHLRLLAPRGSTAHDVLELVGLHPTEHL